MKITKCFLCGSIDIETRYKMPTEPCIVYKDPPRYETKKAVTINKITETLTIKCRNCNNLLFWQTKIYLEGVKDESEKEETEQPEQTRKDLKKTLQECENELEIIEKEEPGGEPNRRKIHYQNTIKNLKREIEESKNQKAIDCEEKEEPPASQGGETR